MGRKIGNELIWADDDAGTAKDLTTSYVASGQTTDWIAVGPANEVVLLLAGGGTDPTSYDVILEMAADDGSVGYLLPAINLVSGGECEFDPLVLEYPGAALGSGYTAERWASPPIRVEPGSRIKAWAKRTGGDATTEAAVYAYLAEV